MHRDLKPANIFLAKDDAEEVVKIVDFGIAKLVGVEKAWEATKTGTILGSPLYMSPEHVRGQWERVDHRADLWSLAVIIFRAITGELPFRAEALADVIMKICSDPIPTASSIEPSLQLAVDAFFGRAFAREPDERFQSAHELAAAFARAIGLEISSCRWSVSNEMAADDEATNVLNLLAQKAAQDSTIGPTDSEPAGDASMTTQKRGIATQDVTTIAIVGEAPSPHASEARARTRRRQRWAALPLIAVVAVTSFAALLIFASSGESVTRVDAWVQQSPAWRSGSASGGELAGDERDTSANTNDESASGGGAASAAASAAAGPTASAPPKGKAARRSTRRPVPKKAKPERPNFGY